MKSTLTLFVLLTLLLSACGTNSAPDAITGVDEIGPYTVVAQSGDESLSAQDMTKTLPTRVMQIREYSGLRYRAVFTVKFPKYTLVGALKASNRLSSKTVDMDWHTTRRSVDTWTKNPKELSVASAIRYIPRKTSGGLPINVCGVADGEYSADDSEGNYHYDEVVRFTSRACYSR